MLTANRVREVLEFDPKNNFYVWRITLSARAVAGRRAGWLDRRRQIWMIAIDGKEYRIERIESFYKIGKDWIDPGSVGSKGKTLTQERLKQILHYDPLTGIFTWKGTRPGKQAGHTKIGDIAGVCRPDGYRVIGVEYRHYRAHRLAWFYMMGKWPKEYLDHINGQRDDNRWTNIREATAGQNITNSIGWAKKPHLKGAYKWNGVNPWRACITVNKKMILLGYFATEQEAHNAYVAAAKIHFGEFANGGRKHP